MKQLKFQKKTTHEALPSFQLTSYKFPFSTHDHASTLNTSPFLPYYSDSTQDSALQCKAKLPRTVNYLKTLSALTKCQLTNHIVYGQTYRILTPDHHTHICPFQNGEFLSLEGFIKKPTASNKFFGGKIYVLMLAFYADEVIRQLCNQTYYLF